MPHDAHTARRIWKDAEAAASAKEAELNAAWSRFFDRRDRMPPDELIQAAAQLRAAADALLGKAQDADMGERALVAA